MENEDNLNNLNAQLHEISISVHDVRGQIANQQTGLRETHNFEIQDDLQRLQREKTDVQTEIDKLEANLNCLQLQLRQKTESVKAKQELVISVEEELQRLKEVLNIKRQHAKDATDLQEQIRGLEVQEECSTKLDRDAEKAEGELNEQRNETTRLASQLMEMNSQRDREQAEALNIHRELALLDQRLKRKPTNKTVLRESQNSVSAVETSDSQARFLTDAGSKKRRTGGLVSVVSQKALRPLKSRSPKRGDVTDDWFDEDI
eukprot:Plantae.Rhodophyta-Purpureofilum_apyrenoidigerum.ctg4551.p1 GENE.Plantae.Rhodophyta-Purpureofilum_apyrenoidigerum.ctg4551~~Plantae.Rhodophyta-Purpureofilum_apyrenoidigerum.ctg4551.p1  ORF type:complete len:288 (-),score=61.11 Plantae.Rhodophyta-Purpureofilum_apyrenoidigerum.ctg4551:80-862(-)